MFFSEPAELSGGHLQSDSRCFAFWWHFFLLCATCRIEIFCLVAGVKARAFYMFLELNLSSQVFRDCCFKRSNTFFSFSGSRC